MYKILTDGVNVRRQKGLGGSEYNSYLSLFFVFSDNKWTFSL